VTRSNRIYERSDNKIKKNKIVEMVNDFSSIFNEVLMVVEFSIWQRILEEVSFKINYAVKVFQVERV